VYAPELEGAMMEYPIIEPLYLFGGAAPITELRGKFTLAEPCRVDETVGPGTLEVGPFAVSVVPLAGHALNQVGVGVEAGDERVLFCADAVFPRETIEKHKVLFCVDLEETVKTIEGLADQPYDCFAPGHGPAYAAGGEIEAICEANAARLTEIRDVVYDALASPQETSALVQQTAEHFGLRITRATAYYLTRTTVLAALSALERGGDVKAGTKANRLMWKRI
jgi:glyoxylase-like metal-dependent hydrolase (beta-lactamase superfamily II)